MLYGDVGAPCDKFAKLKLRQKFRAAKMGKADTPSGGSMALLGQQPSEKEKERRKRRKSKRSIERPCFDCGKKGPIITHCPDMDKKEDKNEDKRDGRASLGNRARRAPVRSPCQGLFI